MKVMLDLNVILDVVQNRSPWAESSARVCTYVESGKKIKGYVSAHGITTVYYIARKNAGRQVAEQAIDWLLGLCDPCPCDRRVFQRARSLPLADFEDAVVVASAEAAKCDYIVTRNVQHFRESPVPAITPVDFLDIIAK